MKNESYLIDPETNTDDIGVPQELAPNDQRLLDRTIQTLEDPLRKIITQLKGSIENGDYKVIIGEDASGRLATFAMHKIFSAIYQENGYPPIETRYLSGNRGNPWLDNILQRKKGQLREYLADLKEHLGIEIGSGKILLVTDHIETGKSLRLLVNLLNQAGIEYDIATVAIDSIDTHNQLEESWGQQIVAGRTTNAAIPGLKDFSGVFKDNPDIHARRMQPGDKEYYGNGGELERELYDEYTQVRVNESRKQVGVLAEKLITEVFHKDDHKSA